MTLPDVTVVGGGISGCSIAFYLAKAGLKVTLIERDFIASGPTGRSSAIIRQHYSNKVTARMALRSWQIWQNFDDAVGGNPHFEPVGVLLATGEESVESLKANIAMQQAVGIDTRFVTPQEIQAMEPNVSLKGIAGGAYEPGSGYADPSASATAFADRAKALGASLMLNTRVTALKTEGSRIAGLVTNNGEISTGAVVLATGPWTPQLARTVGLELPIESSRHEVAVYKHAPSFSWQAVFADFETEVYMRPETGNLMLVGAIEDIEDTVDPDNFNEKITFDTVADYADRVVRRYPAMSIAASAGGWAALYDVTPDWHHIMGPLPGVEALYCTAGSSGHGFKLAPAIGEMMAELIVDGPNPESDLNLFSFDRFAQNKLITGQYEQSIVG
jgi:sarcosine oxidase subunit beta